MTGVKMLELLTAFVVAVIFLIEVSGPMFDRLLGANSNAAMLANFTLGLAIGWSLSGLVPKRIK